MSYIRKLIKFAGALIVLLLIIFVSSCTSGKNDLCIFDPIYLTNEDIGTISEQLSRQILLHNEIWRVSCN